MTKMITVGIIIHGLIEDKTIVIAKTFNPTCSVSVMDCGSVSSMDPISFENLFKILPDGFVLKNLIVAFTMFANMLLCKFLDAFIHTLKKLKDRVNVIIIRKMLMKEWM